MISSAVARNVFSKTTASSYGKWMVEQNNCLAAEQERERKEALRRQRQAQLMTEVSNGRIRYQEAHQQREAIAERRLQLFRDKNSQKVAGKAETETLVALKHDQTRQWAEAARSSAQENARQAQATRVLNNRKGVWSANGQKALDLRRELSEMSQMRREMQDALAEEVQLQAERVRLSTRDGTSFRSSREREHQLEKMRLVGEHMRRTKEALRTLRSLEEERQANLQAEIREKVSTAKAERRLARVRMLEKRQMAASAMKAESRERECYREHQQGRDAMARRLAHDAVLDDKFLSPASS